MMLKNYLKIAWRHLTRNKFYALLNVVGLAVGIACCLIILLYVKDELSYDNFLKKADQIYRIALERHYPERVRSYAIIPHSYAAAVKTEFPEVKEVTRVLYFQNNSLTVKIGEQTFEEPYAYWADSTFFRVFSIPLVKGEEATALNQPNTVVLTEATAKKYFGNRDPIGRTLDLPGPNANELVVTGVCENVPDNSHMRFDLLMSSTSLPFLEQPNYVNFAAYTYVLLNENASPDVLESKLPEAVKKYAAGEVERRFGVSYDDYLKSGHGYHYFLQPLRSIYLDSRKNRVLN